jgi:archaeosortase B (VPXXXP-CTERM-specific)
MPEEADETPAAAEASLFAKAKQAFDNPANRFVVAFLLYLALLNIFYPKFSLRYPELVEWMSRVTAVLGGLSLDLFENDVTQKHKMIIFGGFAVEIIEECTGLYEILIYAAAVFAFPTTLVKKAIGILLGAPILYATNVLRIVFLVWIGRYYPTAFDFMHLYFWQATLILMITGVWLLWIFLVVKRETPADPA